MRASERANLRLFWLMILSGLICAGAGGAFAWLDYSATRGAAERSGWVSGEASLYEIGIRWSGTEKGASYDVAARYVLRVDGREYEGSEVAGGYSEKSIAEVRSLILPYAPEAAEYSLFDLGVLNPQRTWHVAYRLVPARYDPRDPARSQIVLEEPGVVDLVPSWILRAIALCLLIGGGILLGIAGPVSCRVLK